MGERARGVHRREDVQVGAPRTPDPGSWIARSRWKGRQPSHNASDNAPLLGSLLYAGPICVFGDSAFCLNKFGRFFKPIPFVLDELIATFPPWGGVGGCDSPSLDATPTSDSRPGPLGRRPLFPTQASFYCRPHCGRWRICPNPGGYMLERREGEGAHYFNSFFYTSFLLMLIGNVVGSQSRLAPHPPFQVHCFPFVALSRSLPPAPLSRTHRNLPSSSIFLSDSLPRHFLSPHPTAPLTNVSLL